MNRLYGLTIVALLLVCTFSADCPVDASKQPKIQSDSVGLTAQDNKNQGNAQNLIYNYQFNTPFPSAPSVAIGLNEIQAAPSSTLDLRVTNPKASSSGVYFQAESGSDSQWKTFKINFLASSRSDIQLGSTSISSPVINQNENSFNMIYNIKNDLPANGLKAKSFVQGINVYSPTQGQIGVRQESSSISSKQIFFTFSSPLRTSIIRSLTISVIVFNIYTPSVLYADGIIDQNYVVSTLDITIPRHGINELRTYMVGINSFESSTDKSISIYSAVSEKFSIVIGPIDRTQIDYISVSYLILSVIDCGSCVGNPILFEGICQPICPAGYVATKGKCVPIKCKQGQKLNDKGQCVITCGKNEVYQNGACLCAEGYYIINRVCDKCPDGNYFDFKALVCKPVCGVNSVYKAGRCYCNPGYYIIGNRCQQCTYGTTYDPVSQKCYNICQANEVYSPAGCVCANGFYKINGVCSRCPYQRTYDPDTKTCVCGAGLENVYGTCVPVCKQREARLNGNCVCARGYYLVDGVCSTCGKDSDYDSVNARCVCKPNTMWVPSLGCVANCTNQQYFSNGNCVNYCSQYYELYQGGQCVCYPDFERVNGVCVASCATNEYRDANGVCRCYSGYFKGSYSPICQPVNCPAGTAFDETRADCISICKYGEYYINGACVCGNGYFRNSYGDCAPQCSSTQVMINGICQCPAGWARAALGVCCPMGSGPEKCPPGNIFVYGVCAPPSLCKANEYWCGSGCACNYGYYRINGQCVPVTPTLVCPANSESNGLNCLCKQGYYPIRDGVCERCSSGLSWDGRICSQAPRCQNGWNWDNSQNRCVLPLSCKDNQYWDGAQCRCQQGYYPIQGVCSTCPLGTVFDGVKCNQGVTPQYCKDPYSIWNGYYCACISGYWPLADGKCTSCIDGTYWDGTCCKPRNGQYIPLTVAY